MLTHDELCYCCSKIGLYVRTALMTKELPTIVLLDMDGTTVRHINPWLLHILERLDDAGHKIAGFFSKLTKQKIQSPPLVEFRHGKRPKLLVHRALHKVRRKPVDQIVEPCPGIFDVLDLLKENNITIGLVSNGLGKGYGHDILKEFGLEPYFDVTIFREDIKRSKPHPDPLLRAVEGLKRKPDENDLIWYIGDRRKDITSAMAAKDYIACDIVPFGYGINAALAVLDNQLTPDHILMGWPDLEHKLLDILKKKVSQNELSAQRETSVSYKKAA